MVVTTPSLGHVAAQPGHLRCREVRIERESGGASELIGQAGHVGADRRGSAVLPRDGRAERAARGAIPGQDGLALIGEADGRDAIARPGRRPPVRPRRPIPTTARGPVRRRRPRPPAASREPRRRSRSRRPRRRRPPWWQRSPGRWRGSSPCALVVRHRMAPLPAPWAAFPAPSSHPDRREGAPDGSVATIPVTRRRGLLSCPQHPLLSRPGGRPTKGDARA